jgi:hypothetical protein
MSTMEDTVRSVVTDFMTRGVLFTALDVSNAVKTTLPHTRHREVRDVVRAMFSTDIEVQGWARTPITVTLPDNTTAEALLYHPLTDSWDLDNKYSNQQRTATSFRPLTAAQATVAQAQVVNVSAAAVAAGVAALTAPVAVTPAPAPVSARAQWDQMFQSATSLFPKP